MKLALGILGVMQTTLREAIHTRVFVLLAFFALLTLGVIPFFPTLGIEDTVKFISTWSLFAGTTIGAITMIFLIGPTISREIAERNLQQVLVKPVSRLVYVFARTLGYSLIVLLLFLLMGLVTYFSLRSGLAGELSSSRTFQTAKLYQPTDLQVLGRTVPSQDWEVKKWLAPGGILRYEFPVLPKESKPQLVVSLPGSIAGMFANLAPCDIRLKNLSTQEEWHSGVAIGQELQILEPPYHLFQDGRTEIELSSRSGRIGLGGRQLPPMRGVRLLVPEQGSLLVNTVNLFLYRGFGLSILISITFAAACLMSGKIAICLALSILLALFQPVYSHIFGSYLRGETKLGEHSHGDAHEHQDEDEKTGPLSLPVSILAFAADALAAALPDLEQFEYQEEFLEGYNLGSHRIFELLSYLLVFHVVCLGVSGVVLKTREYM